MLLAFFFWFLPLKTPKTLLYAAALTLIIDIDERQYAKTKIILHSLFSVNAIIHPYIYSSKWQVNK